MTRWVSAAALTICVLAIVLAADGPEPSPSRSGARAPNLASPLPSAVPRDLDLERTAVAFALATRNWSASTRLAAWRRQRALAGGLYRRLLDRARPTRAQLSELATERTSTIAVLAAPASSLRTGTRARVLVELDEHTATAGQTTSGRTRNRVSLRARGGAWRVTGWTILPGPGR